MKTSTAMILLLILATGLISAGQIEGRITFAGRPVGEKVKIEVQVPVRAPPKSAETDNKGGYRLYVPAKGRGILVVHYRLGNQDLSPQLKADIESQDRTVIYNFDITRNPDGT